MNSISSGYAVRFFESVCCESSATDRILNQLYPEGPRHIACGTAIIGKRSLASFWRGDRTWCTCCETRFNPRSGTLLDGSQLSYAQFEVVLVLISLGIDHKRIASMAGCHDDTVKAWVAKIAFWESR